MTKYLVQYWSMANQTNNTTYMDGDLRRALKWAREAVEEGYRDQANASVYKGDTLVARYVNSKGKAVGLAI